MGTGCSGEEGTPRGCLLAKAMGGAGVASCTHAAPSLLDTARRIFQGIPSSLKSPQEITAKSQAVPFLLPRPHLRQSPEMETNGKALQPGRINNGAKCKRAVTAC